MRPPAGGDPTSPVYALDAGQSRGTPVLPDPVGGGGRRTRHPPEDRRARIDRLFRGEESREVGRTGRGGVPVRARSGLRPAVFRGDRGAGLRVSGGDCIGGHIVGEPDHAFGVPHRSAFGPRTETALRAGTLSAGASGGGNGRATGGGSRMPAPAGNGIRTGLFRPVPRSPADSCGRDRRRAAATVG